MGKTRRASARAFGVTTALLFGGIVAPAMAQEVVDLGPATDRHREPFALVQGVHELSDGRVRLADPLGGVFQELSPDLTRALDLGQEGQGPDEFLQPDRVWALPGDTTLLVDLGNARLTWVAPDGTFTRTRPILVEPFAPGRPLSLMIPGGVDRAGRIYFRMTERAGPDGEPADSASVLRFDPATESTRELVRVKTADVETRTSGARDNRSVSVTPVPLSVEDGWVVAPDGSLAVLRSSPYRLEWFTPEGQRFQRGPPLETEEVDIGGAEREEWAIWARRAGGVGVGVEVRDGQATVSMSRSAGETRRELSAMPFPDRMRPFAPETARLDRLGRVWVQRSLPAGERPLYDLFDGAGRHLGAVRLPADSRVIGFGAGVVYLAKYDDLDLIHLQRHDLPSF